MKNHLNLFLSIGIIVLFLAHGCKKTTEDFSIQGKEYAAERVGKERIYKVDSQIFNINTTFGNDTIITYFERHLTKAIEIDSAGKSYFYHQVFKAPNLLDWEPSFTYRSYVDSLTLIKVHNNKKVIHLWWPINDFRTWDGNLYNNERGGQNFRYISTDEFLEPDSVYADQVNVRLKKEILPITESNVHMESYAPNIGMVYSIKYYNNIQFIDTSNINSQSGYYLHHNLIKSN